MGTWRGGVRVRGLVGRESLSSKANVFALTLLMLMSTPVPIAHAADGALKFQKTIGVDAEAGWNGWMSFVAFSPDGTMVASDGPTSPHDRAGALTLWSFPEGRLIGTVPFRPLAIADNWKYYASDHGVIDVQSEKPLAYPGESGGDWFTSGLSADGRYVAFRRVSSGDRTVTRSIRVVRTADGAIVNEFGRRAVLSLAFHPDGTTLASGHWDNVTLWNVLTGERIALLRGFGRYVVGIGFSRDGQLLAAGTDFGGLEIWDVSSRTRLHALDLGLGPVSAPAFSPDGRWLAAGVYGSGTVWLVDVSTGRILDHARVSDMGCGSVAFSPDGRFLITPSTGGLVTWPYDRGGTIRVFEVRREEATSTGLAPGDRGLSENGRGVARILTPR